MQEYNENKLHQKQVLHYNIYALTHLMTPGKLLWYIHH